MKPTDGFHAQQVRRTFNDGKSACFQDFVPDQRIKLWCFQAERAIGKKNEQRNQGLVKTGVIEWTQVGEGSNNATNVVGIFVKEISVYVYIYIIMHCVGWCHMRIPVKIRTDVTLEILMVDK